MSFDDQEEAFTGGGVRSPVSSSFCLPEVMLALPLSSLPGAILHTYWLLTFIYFVSFYDHLLFPFDSYSVMKLRCI